MQLSPEHLNNSIGIIPFPSHVNIINALGINRVVHEVWLYTVSQKKPNGNLPTLRRIN